MKRLAREHAGRSARLAARHPRLPLGAKGIHPMISYIANRIGCEIFEGIIVAGIGNESIGYVMFQRGTTTETGGDEPPYFEFNDQFNGGTDVVEMVI